MKLKLIIGLLVIMIGSLPGIGQDYSAFTCPVKVNNFNLKYPFTGGFSAPQFSNLDINQDGIMDLFVFDRIGNVPMFFEYEGQGLSSAYNYNTEYKNITPDNMCCWAFARDYNGDGVEDLFSVPIELGINGLALYEGSYTNGKLSYTQKKIGGDPEDSDVIWFDIGNSTFPVTVPFNDLPDIVDVDFDGDLDILSFDLDGSYVAYYKNMQIEDGLSSDTMLYELHDICFGKIMESGFSENIFLSDNPLVCATGVNPNSEEKEKHYLHSGSTVMAYDNDDDNDMDLLIGDLTNRGLVYLENGGDSEQNLITSLDTDFPEYDLAVDMSIFLGSFFVDVDGDNLKDLIVAPNQKSSITNSNNIWYYKNTGDPQKRFSYRQDNFLGDQTLDFGSSSYPVFVDYNADGLKDIVVTTDGEFGSFGPAEIAMYLFKNTGTASNPEFELVDDDYLGFRSFSTTSTNPAPSFGDLDGDQDIDLLIGDSQGKLYFFENTAGPDQELQFKSPIYNYMNIDIGQDAKPEIVDLNEDGLGDIVLGTRISFIQDGTIGNLIYLQNQGTFGNPFFDPVEEAFPNTSILGKVDVRTSSSGGEMVLSAPCFVKKQNNWILLVGSDSRGVNLYSDIENNTYNEFTLEESDLGNLKEGRAITVDAWDIDNDGFLELMMGNKRGGISFYNSDIESETVSVSDVEENTIPLFSPNPTEGYIYLNANPELQARSIRIVNSLGQYIYNLDIESKTYNLSHLSSGIYFILIETKDAVKVQKILKL